MLETDIKKFKESLVLQLENAKDQELHWEAKAYAECIKMLDSVLKKNGIEVN
ncbi:MAG: hypothetical protein LBC75_12990 [Fibromonadaceae bacterium]|jgi:hypothetical protein|nr:hypothetical protein [Fibromonadaceae bacterium]